MCIILSYNIIQNVKFYMLFKHIKCVLSITTIKLNHLLLHFGGANIEMARKYNVSCSETLNRKWTKSAADCYFMGCVCSKCFIYKVIFSKRSYKCMMKNTVIELVRQIGKPKEKDYDI